MDLNYVQRCKDFVTAVAIKCGPMTSLRIEMRHESPHHEQQPRTSHLRTDAGPCIVE
jgi:hypothetical protein